jgi:hypothetical protein
LPHAIPFTPFHLFDWLFGVPKGVNIIFFSVNIGLHVLKETAGNILQDAGKRFPQGRLMYTQFFRLSQ